MLPVFRPGTCLPIAFFILLCSSCAETEKFTTLKASADFAKTVENGNSMLTYDSKTGENVVAYEEWDLEKALTNIFARDVDEFPTEAKPQNGHFGLSAGFGFVGKGTKAPGGAGKLSLNYLEVPLQAIYRYPIAQGSPAEGNAYGGFGPYFAYGIGGKAKGGGFEQNAFGNGTDNAGYKRFDAGLAFTLGYKLNKGFSLDLGYDLGLANNISAGQDVKSHNRCFSINLGYEISRLYRH